MKNKKMWDQIKELMKNDIIDMSRPVFYLNPKKVDEIYNQDKHQDMREVMEHLVLTHNVLFLEDDDAPEGFSPDVPAGKITFH